MPAKRIVARFIEECLWINIHGELMHNMNIGFLASLPPPTVLLQASEVLCHIRQGRGRFNAARLARRANPTCTSGAREGTG